MSDKIEQIWGNAFTNATKHKETTVHKRFRQKKTKNFLSFFFFSFFGCKKRDEEDIYIYKVFVVVVAVVVESACVLLFLCVLSHW